MSNKDTYDPQEWAQLLRSPTMAAMAVTAASPSGPVGIIKEMFAAGRMLADVKVKGSNNKLISALVADLQTPEGRSMGREGMQADLDGASPADIRARAIDALKHAAAIVDAKGSPQEAADFKEWLRELTQKVAEAAKEGGFLGFGGVQVSGEEQTALNEISQALGLSEAARIL
ncbi:MAG: hypothetical protein IPK78_08195 [Rhodospirillales bacterium]|nr:hypothetical protein [Rhodospirillales bacterium]